MSGLSRVVLVALVCCLLFSGAVRAARRNIKNGVSFDGKSLIVGGKRELLFSGSIHYPRMTPEAWPDILKKAKAGGLNVIQTYIFWNLHEPIEGHFDFVGYKDFVKFIKLIGKHKMFATLRVGPFIEAEWNHGGFPYWLREVPNITFRSDNPPFKYYMQKFTKMVIKMAQEEKLFAPQGGPIILAQIENEYNSIELAYKERGTRYVQWAGNLAVGLQTGVPWVMCKQKDAPDPVINTCNGRNCGDTFTGPNKPSKPTLWTENWTAQYRVFGDPPSQRAAEDIAFSVARFFSKNGTLANYYMYYGGTNFGRTSSSFVTPRYYDEAPIDEYGFTREPKYGHLRDLHSALNLCKKALLWGSSSVQKLGDGLEARIYEIPGSHICAAFLTNNDTKFPATVKFKGAKYFLPQHSISILPDCKTVVYNTQTIVAQHNSRNYHESEKAKNLQWQMYTEKIPTPVDGGSVKSNIPLLHWALTKDTSDYLWYTSSIVLDQIDLPVRKDILPVLQVSSLGHIVHAFVNGEYVGSAHGNNIENSFLFQKPITGLKIGTNHISLLSGTVGLPDSGTYLEKRMSGVHAVRVQGLNTGTLVINGWTYKVGLDGERFKVFRQGGFHRVGWTKAKTQGPPLTWYKAYFDAPEGNDPLAIQMRTMSKGMVWVNGKCIGRHWVSFLSPLGKPSQATYHIPRGFVKPTENLLTVFDEEGGNPYGIKILTVNRDMICSYVTENHIPHVKSWKREDSVIKTVAGDAKPEAFLECPEDKEIVSIDFASYGNPYGSCGKYNLGDCASPDTMEVVKKTCLGKSNCAVPLDQQTFDKGGKMCPKVTKILAIQAQCGKKK